MNATDLYSGQDYAYVDYISRGIPFYPNAKRGKVLRVFKKREWGKERDTTYVELLCQDEDGTFRTNHDGSDRTVEVRARDIYARWDEHQEQLDLYRARKAREEAEWQERLKRQADERMRLEAERRERARIEEEERLARLEQERLEREEQERQERERLELIYSLLERRKIPRRLVKFASDSEIVLDREQVEQWLGVLMRV